MRKSLRWIPAYIVATILTVAAAALLIRIADATSRAADRGWSSSDAVRSDGTAGRDAARRSP